MRLTIRLDVQNRTLYADLCPSEESETITGLFVKGKLDEAGYGKLTLDPQPISELLVNAQQGKECSVALKTLVDATVSVTISPDKHQAFLTLTAPEGGRSLTLVLIIKAIMKAGVAVALVNQETVNTCFHQQLANDVCIAQARLPLNGQDAVFLPLVESETILVRCVDDQGEDEMLDTHQFLVVEVGAPLMRRVPATEGEAGVDVTGNVMKPAPGNDAGFAKKLTGVEPSSENPNVLVAALKGHPVIVENGVNVDPTLHLDNVDANSGNIIFDGSLEVKGEVVAGMTIDVTGDVFIQGGVDRATIKAGQSIKVGGGIYGDEKCEQPEEEVVEYKINAGSDIEAKFVHLSTLAAGNNIVVKEYVWHSQVQSGNQLLLGQEGGKGMVLGGRCEALHRIAVNQLGNESDIPTQITAGKLSELYKVYHNLEKELAARTNEVTQLEAIVHKQRQGTPALLGKTPLEKTQKIQNIIVAIQKKMARIHTLLKALEPEIALQKKAMIAVGKTIYPNAVMIINGTMKRFSEQTRGETWVQRGDALVDQVQAQQEEKAKLKKKESCHAC